MSRIAAIVGRAGAPSRAIVERMLAATGSSATSGDGDEHCWMGVSAGAGTRPADLFARDGAGRMVVADASLYYRDDLRRALRVSGVEQSGTAIAGLLLDAYAAWGDGMAERLEGDFAFALWDPVRRRLVAARDFTGRRPLYHADAGGALLVASNVESLLAHPGCAPDLDLAALAASAAALLETPGDTAYRAIRVVPAGGTLALSLDAEGGAGSPHVTRHWSPPTFERPGEGRSSFADAAAELRATLVRAVAERMDPAARPTAVWLSGGWDSTAVFAAGCEALRASGAPASLRLDPISMSYPPDDPAREDELIAMVCAHWEREPRWCDIAEVSLFGDAWTAAAHRPLPFAHPYQEWTRTLSSASVGAGARVVLDGTGGDQLFQVSPVYMADLLVRGQWLAAHAEWRARAMRGSGWRRFARYAVLPWMPAAALRAAAALRGGRPVHGLRSRPLPPWIRAEAARQHDLAARATLPLRRRRGETQSALESRWYFESGYSPAVLGEQSAVARASGVELRSPLYDGRIVAIAARRPREERSGGGETKRLLRAAMRGLLPEEVLAPRERRTGTTAAFFRRAMERELPPLVARVLESSRLAELGILDPAAFATAVDRYVAGADSHLDVALFQTVQTELWLRARASTPAGVDAAPAAPPLMLQS